MLQDLVAHGYRVHAVAPEDDAEVRSVLQQWQVEYHTVPLNRSGISLKGDLKLFQAYHQLLQRLKPQVVFAYTIKPVIFGSLAARMAGVKKMVSMITGLGYSFSAEAKSHVKLISRLLYRTALSTNQTVIFQNPDDRDLFLKEGLTSAGKVRIVNGSGVDVQQFAVQPLPANRKRFLLIARLLRDKGIREYAEAARLVHQKHPEAEFYLLGPTDPSPNAIQQSELDAWVQEGTLKYLGATKDVRPFIAEYCSVYVLPSYREGTPRSVLEAMSLGRAIITTDTPGCRETVEDGVNGRLVPVKESAGLAQAMLEFLDHPEQVEQMARKSRQLVEEKYAVEKVNAVLLEILQ
ncbi:glycosyl transferase [Deinococcus roseus]|uniref:Glycosyl transferase n=2 Tax=Deinococcus roseus TaxID=392414 RepID=A0ABQ2CVH0_9DEIO|nr:glycosyl transferase [Deinococcus roseus]